MTIVGTERGRMIWYGNDVNDRGAILHDDGSVVFGFWERFTPKHTHNKNGFKINTEVLVTSGARRSSPPGQYDPMPAIKRWMNQ